MIVGNRISIELLLATQNLLVGFVLPVQPVPQSHRKSGVRMNRPPQPFSHFHKFPLCLPLRNLGFDGDPLAWFCQVLSGSAIQPTVARDTPEMLI